MNSKILRLFRKYIDNQCSTAELDEALKLMDEPQHQEELVYVLAEEKLSLNYVDETSTADADLLARINTTIAETSFIKSKKLQFNTKYIAAAVLAIISGIGIYMFVSSNSLTLKSETTAQNKVAIATNNSNVYLTLANGKRIILSDFNLATLASMPSVDLTKTKNGQLVYKINESNSDAATPLFNKIEIPNCTKFQLYLPDGTKVWLNAGTTLKYPVSFKNLKERKVELAGEAYFEVAHNKAVPFKVYVDDNVVEVLGTKFNINSYSNEPSVNTTLLQGSVKITVNANTPSVIIKPGEQASITDRKINISDIDTEEIIAWKNGDFIFKNQDFKTVMRSIGRWYDLDIVYENESPILVKPGGWISRKNTVNEVLEMIEATGKVKFKMQGRRIIIKN